MRQRKRKIKIGRERQTGWQAKTDTNRKKEREEYKIF